MRNTKRLGAVVLVVSVLALQLSVIGGCCRKKTTGEKVGEAIEDAGDAVKDATN